MYTGDNDDAPTKNGTAGARRREPAGEWRTVERYDVVVIGGGWGGYTAAVAAARHGRRVALVERDQLGGVCLHRGCIPTKVLLQTADLLATARRAEEFGVRLPAPELDYARVRERKAAVVGQLFRGLQGLVRASNVTLIAGVARLTGPTTVAIDNGQSLTADQIIIATGSRPRPLPGVPFDGRAILSSDHLLEVEQPPRSLIVLGAGAVGVEFASCYADYGSEVTLVEMAPLIVPLEDHDVSAALARSLTARGIRILTGARARSESIAPAEGGVRLEVETGGTVETLAAEALLVAIGRQAVTDDLGLEAAGVAVERGFITVDDQMRTTVPSIYAVGDVNGGLLLAHVAAAEGEVAAGAIAGQRSIGLDSRRLPRATYCRPQVASAGLSEREATAAGHLVITGRAQLRANGKALITGEPEGFVKIVADQHNGDVLGVHMIGAHTTELIAEIALGQLLDMADRKSVV